MSAASGLALVGRHLVVVADDAHHLGVFPIDSTEPGWSQRIIEGDLPEAATERKRVKPDFEALAVLPPTGPFPNGALVAVGSGSTQARETAMLIELDSAGGLTDRLHRRDLGSLYGPLRERVGELNVEGAFVLGNDLMLLSRANRSAPANQVARYRLADLVGWLGGDRVAAVVPRSVTALHVGEIDGVPLGLTDGAALPGGGWVFSAAAEDTSDSYADGAVRGATVGVMSDAGEITVSARLQPNVKVEGIAVRVSGGVATLKMVTDADDPSTAALLLTATLPG